MKGKLVPCISGAIIEKLKEPAVIAMMTLIIWLGLACPSLMSVVPKLNAGHRWLEMSEPVGGQEFELTNGVNSIDGKEKEAQTHALGD